MRSNLNDQGSVPELTKTQCRADNAKYKVFRTRVDVFYLFKREAQEAFLM